ncbi:MAG TPA: hypothetical protein PKD05_18105 [Candidatus Melainabacteria bacterium]|nr:hypothetical protein [Candidatus Melainabacteria bacterium]
MDETRLNKEKSQFEVKLLIMRGVFSLFLVWVLAQIYVLSSTGGDTRTMLELLNKESLAATELQERLKMLEEVGDSKDLYQTREQWMLTLLKNGLVDSAVEQADKQVEALKQDQSSFEPDQKFAFYETAAVVYRGAQRFDRLDSLYKDIDSSLKPSDKAGLISLIENNRAVSRFCSGLSVEVLSLEDVDKRIKAFEEAKVILDPATKRTLAPDLAPILLDNKKEFDDEIAFAKLRRASYNRSKL